MIFLSVLVSTVTEQAQKRLLCKGLAGNLQISNICHVAAAVLVGDWHGILPLGHVMTSCAGVHLHAAAPSARKDWIQRIIARLILCPLTLDPYGTRCAGVSDETATQFRRRLAMLS